MLVAQDDCFVVYVREENPAADGDLPIETEMVRCSSYGEARWLCQRYSIPGRKYVIRFVGTVGGGD